MMKKFVYFREFGTIEGYDCSVLTLRERLFLSCILTKFRYNDGRTLGEILFNYDGFHTGRNFKDFDKMVTDVVSKKLGKLQDFIVENAAKLNEKTVKNEDGADRYKIHGITIETEKLFKTKLGSHGTSLDSIAWRSFALAAAKSKSKVTEWRALNIYQWLTDEVTLEKIMKTTKTTLKRNIESWLREAEIAGEFKGDFFIVDANGCGNGELRGCSKSRKDKQQEQKVQKEQEKIENAIKKAPIGTKVFDVIKNEDTEDYAYVNEVHRWKELYGKLYAANEEKWQKILRWIQANWGSISEAITKIGKKHKVSKDVLDKAIRDEYLTDKEGGLVMKNSLRKDLLELRQHILNSEIDESWCKNPVVRKINVAFAYKCWPDLMGME